MEKPEGFYKHNLVGIPTDKKHLEKEWKTYLRDRVETVGGGLIENFEVEKTAKEIELIKLTEGNIDTLMNMYNHPAPSTPLQNIHVLKENGVHDYLGGNHRSGVCSSSLKSILIDRTPSDTQFCLILFHELLHLKSYSSLQIIRGSEDGKIEPYEETYRSGISVISRDGKTTYFNKFEEGVIGHLTKSFYEEVLLKDPHFNKDAKENALLIRISRQEEAHNLYKIVEEIFQKNSKDFSSSKEVLDVFIRAQITGKILPVIRLLINTFGKDCVKTIDALI